MVSITPCASACSSSTTSSIPGCPRSRYVRDRERARGRTPLRRHRGLAAIARSTHQGFRCRSRPALSHRSRDRARACLQASGTILAALERPEVARARRDRPALREPHADRRRVYRHVRARPCRRARWPARDDDVVARPDVSPDVPSRRARRGEMVVADARRDRRRRARAHRSRARRDPRAQPRPRGIGRALSPYRRPAVAGAVRRAVARRARRRAGQEVRALGPRPARPAVRARDGRPRRSAPASARCSAASARCSASRRLASSRTSGSSARSICCA